MPLWFIKISYHTDYGICPNYIINVYMSNMLTILRDQDYSMATIYHVMDKIRDTVSLLSRSANIWHSQTDSVAVTRR